MLDSYDISDLIIGLNVKQKSDKNMNNNGIGNIIFRISARILIIYIYCRYIFINGLIIR